MTKLEIINRISLLSDEINTNEEENRMMQDEIDKLYEQLDEMENPLTYENIDKG